MLQKRFNNKNASTYTQIHFNKKKFKKWETFLFFFFWFSLKNLSSQKFYKNPKICWKFVHNLHTHLSQCQIFIFNLKSCKDLWVYIHWEVWPKKCSVWYCFYTVFYCFPIFIRYCLKISYVKRIFSSYIFFSIIGGDITLIIL